MIMIKLKQELSFLIFGYHGGSFMVVPAASILKKEHLAQSA